MLTGDERPTPDGRRVEVDYHEDATGPEHSRRLRDCDVPLIHVVEGVHDQHRVHALSTEGEAGGVPSNRGQATGTGATEHSGGRVYDQPFGCLDGLHPATRPTGDVDDAVHVPLGTAKA